MHTKKTKRNPKATLSTGAKTTAGLARAKNAPGRPSKLTPKDWDEIRRRLAAGETTSALAREFGVGKATVSEHCSQKVTHLKTLANTMVATERTFEGLPISEQAAVLNLVDMLKATGNNLAAAARSGSFTSARLAEMARGKAVQLNPENVDAGLREIAALTQVANQAATIGTAVMAANAKATPVAESRGPSMFESMTDQELDVLLERGTNLFLQQREWRKHSSTMDTTAPPDEVLGEAGEAEKLPDVAPIETSHMARWG